MVQLKSHFPYNTKLTGLTGFSLRGYHWTVDTIHDKNTSGYLELCSSAGVPELQQCRVGQTGVPGGGGPLQSLVTHVQVDQQRHRPPRLLLQSQQLTTGTGQMSGQVTDQQRHRPPRLLLQSQQLTTGTGQMSGQVTDQQRHRPPRLLLQSQQLTTGTGQMSGQVTDQQRHRPPRLLLQSQQLTIGTGQMSGQVTDQQRHRPPRLLLQSQQLTTGTGQMSGQVRKSACALESPLYIL